MVEPMLVSMNDFPVSAISQYFDGLPLTMAGKRVPTDCSKASAELMWHSEMSHRHYRGGQNAECIPVVLFVNYCNIYL